jgi:hypothetical protein
MRYGQRALNMDRLGVKTLGARRLSVSGRHRRERPAICEVCGRVGDIQCHHRNYNVPDDIFWVCRFCHATLQKQHRDAGFDCTVSGWYR